MFTFTSADSLHTLNENPYKGHVVVLVNEFTQSAAEYLTMSIQTGENVTIIESQTAGADGNISTLCLPGGLTTTFSGIGIYYPNGDQTQRKGIKIDIESKQTIEDFINNRDTALEKAISYLNGLKSRN